jgi:hypothetical protein
VPVAGAILLIRFVSGGFGTILSENTSVNTESENDTKRSTGFLGRLSNIFCISENEKAGWSFTLSTIKRDRKFKQAVYPNFGILLVLSVILLKPDVTNLVSSLRALNDINRYIFLMILGFSVNNAILQLSFTDTPEAAWIYRALPFSAHGELLTGSIKVILTKFLLPVYMIVVIPVTILWGLAIIPQVLLSLLGNILLVLIVVAFQDTILPFTRMREMQQKGINSLRSILSMILMFGVATGIYMTRLLPFWLTIPLCLLIFFSNIMIFRNIRNRKFKFA